jgi:hypothetical protein
MGANDVDSGARGWLGRIRLWAVSMVIVSYLGSLGYGIVCHTLNFNTASHPAMYFVVWDMFCGWSAYANRLHIIGEGEDGKYYELAPGPWTKFTPFGDLTRHHYDPFLNHSSDIVRNCLEHTRAKPMRRLLVIEEYWAKKYNLPDSVWTHFFDEPRQKHSYFQLRQVMAPCGTVVRRFPSWLDRQNQLVVSAQPLPSHPDSNSAGLSSEIRSTMRPLDGRASGLIPSLSGGSSPSLFPPADFERAPLAQ